MMPVAAVKAQDTFEYWHYVTCRNYSLTECVRYGDAPFRAALTIKDLGSVTVSEVTTGTQVRATRTSVDIRRDPRDFVMLWVVLEGQIGLAQGDRATLMQGGDLFAYDQSQQFTLDFVTPSRALAMAVPRPLLTCRISQVDRIGGCRIADAGLGTVAGSLINQLYSLDSEELLPLISTSALDIIAAIFEKENRGTLTPPLSRAQLECTKRFILEHLHDPMLDVNMIAKAQKTGRRTLFRLFAEEGSTPMRWLWQQRLARSYRALAEGRITQVTDAAFSNGFSDLAHFSRTFKAKFGVSPQTLKRRSSKD